MKLDPQSVNSREQLAEFIEGFREKLLANPGTWENATLESFLSALARYIEDVPEYLKNSGSVLSPDAPSWQLFAILLSGARVYE